MPRFPKGSQEAKDYMASIRAKRGSGVSGSKEEGSEKKPLIPRPSKLKDTDEVREQLNKNRYVIANQVEKALKKGEITKEDRDYLLTLLGMPYRSGKDDVNEIADNQSEVFMGLMELTAKKGSGMGSCSCKGKGKCSCMSGGALDTPAPAPAPPPSPPSPPVVRRVTGLSLNSNLFNNPRISRIVEITEHLLAGRDASMPVGQFYSQQQVETLQAERARLELELNQLNQPNQPNQPEGQGLKKKIKKQNQKN
jgi:hypothetical protein